MTLRHGPPQLYTSQVLLLPKQMMSTKDFGGYKRIVQYFWDPEPKNDDPCKSPIWCLGRRYDSPSQASPNNTMYENDDSGERHSETTKRGNAPSQSNRQEAVLVNAKDILPSRPNGVRREDDREWPSSFLDDFESRIWFTYRSGFPPIRRSDDPNASSLMTFTVRLRSQLVDQGGFSSDTGWGCMIRSGQSLLANTLAMLRLGRGTQALLIRKRQFV